MASAFHSLRNRICVKIMDIKYCEQISSVWTLYFFKADTISVSEPTGFLHKTLVLSHVTVEQKMKSWCYGLQSPAEPGLLYLNSVCGISTNPIFLISWEGVTIFSLKGAKGLTQICIVEQLVKYQLGSDFHCHHSCAEFCQLLCQNSPQLPEEESTQISVSCYFKGRKYFSYLPICNENFVF